MNQIECPGLTADWLNSWLASIGLLVLEPRLHLSWTPDANPVAILSTYDGSDPLTVVVRAWPHVERLRALPIARSLDGFREMKRTVPLDIFLERAECARGHMDSWAMSSSITDLFLELPGSKTKHADLDAPAPKGTTLHDRLMKCFDEVSSPSDFIPATLQGNGRRVEANGLGFDASRISGLADSSDTMVDPVVEVLAFFGLRMLPMRGRGIEVGISGTRDRFAARQRCWHFDSARRPQGQYLAWAAWLQPLDYPGVDALLDQWSRLVEQSIQQRRRYNAEMTRLGIHAAWQTRRYIKRSNSDVTRGFTSIRMQTHGRRR